MKASGPIMLRVYNYMLMGLALSGATAWLALNTPLGALFFAQTATGFSLSPLGWIALFAPLGLVFFLSFRIHAMSFLRPPRWCSGPMPPSTA